MTTCGQCAFGKPIPTDISKRVCHGSPPQVLLVPTSNGASIQVMRPNVSAQDMACGVFRPRHPMQSHMEAAHDALNEAGRRADEARKVAS